MKQAVGRWRGILAHYIDDSYLTGKHGPCPLCGGKDRYRFIDKNGKGTWICSTCTPESEDGMSLLMAITGKSFKDLAADLEGFLGTVKTETQKEKPDPRVKLNKIAKQTSELTGTDPVSIYLLNRGIKITPSSVRHAELDYYHEGKSIGRYSVMVSRISTPGGKRVSFHLTYLRNGNKANVPSAKKIMPPYGTVKGAGVYLGRIASHMIIGEGIETTLAGMQMHNLSGIAAISASGMEHLQLPESVNEITILADNDLSFTGQAAAYALAKRTIRNGKAARVIVPERAGTDYADLLQGAA
ncbi:MAG: toprim domain-containing protein [Candidatus Thiodiazotropha lotti]|nr:toprim domain-containing protein [Candidatus Thiodiazotropha lotti]